MDEHYGNSATIRSNKCIRARKKDTLIHSRFKTFFFLKVFPFTAIYILLRFIPSPGISLSGVNQSIKSIENELIIAAQNRRLFL